MHARWKCIGNAAWSEAICDAGLAAEAQSASLVWTESLAGVEIERRVPGRATPKSLAVTPVLNCLLRAG